jgi:hypothetical protein
METPRHGPDGPQGLYDYQSPKREKWESISFLL